MNQSSALFEIIQSCLEAPEHALSIREMCSVDR